MSYTTLNMLMWAIGLGAAAGVGLGTLLFWMLWWLEKKGVIKPE